MKKAGTHSGTIEDGGQKGLLHHPSEPYVRLSQEVFITGLEASR
jgi:hypothetical protein